MPASLLTKESRPGVLRGDGFESQCRVQVITKLTYGMPSIPFSHEIEWVAKMPPNGYYTLTVSGVELNVRLIDRQWSVAAEQHPLLCQTA